jgi:hypothetical protein
MPHNRSDYELDERAAEATFLLNHPILKEVFEELRHRYIDQVAASLTGSDDLMAAHAKLRVLHEVHNHIQSLIRDKQMKDKKGRQYG